MSRDRSYRRWALQREKARIRYVVRHCWYEGRACAEDPEFIGRMASAHMKFCSSQLHGCGNPRRSKGYHKVLTVQERRVGLDDYENLCVPWWNSDERMILDWVDDDPWF